MAKKKTNIEVLRDPAIAEAYLKKSMDIFTRTGDSEVFLTALSHLTKSQGGMTALARKCKTNRQSLYRAFAETGNPKLKTLSMIINALGYNLAIEPNKSEEKDESVEETINRITKEITQTI